jgi:hypothetical protein
MQKKTKSILDELFLKEEDFSLSLFESRADHVLNSVINLFEMIESLPITEKEQSDIEKRILLSIKNKDSQKFNKYISTLRRKHERI